MKKLSKFDLGIIIAFVVIGLLGGGAWWYLSGQLASAQQDVSDAKSQFDKNSASQDIIVSQANAKALRGNIDLLTAQLDPLIKTKFQAKEDKLFSVEKKDPVAWRHELDKEVGQLTDAAKLHHVTIPPNFYFAFSRYLSKSPEDEHTVVLSKQLIGIDQISSILINDSVKSIEVIRRTYEEDPRPSGTSGSSEPGTAEVERIPGFSNTAGSGVYTDYPFEFEFDTTSTNLRKIVDDLLQSPYIFIIRSLTIQNLQPNSPEVSDLDKLAGTDNSASVVGSSPGEVAATTSTKAPQFLFGETPLHVKARIDMIEWDALISNATTTPANPGAKPSTPAGN